MVNVRTHARYCRRQPLLSEFPLSENVIRTFCYLLAFFLFFFLPRLMSHGFYTGLIRSRHSVRCILLYTYRAYIHNIIYEGNLIFVTAPAQLKFNFFRPHANVYAECYVLLTVGVIIRAKINKIRFRERNSFFEEIEITDSVVYGRISLEVIPSAKVNQEQSFQEKTGNIFFVSNLFLHVEPPSGWLHRQLRDVPAYNAHSRVIKSIY